MPPRPRPLPDGFRLHPRLREALQTGEPVVALESTVITHGLPRPINLDLARRMEAEVRAAGSLPATVAVIEGEVRIGLQEDLLERLAMDAAAIKVGPRDFATARLRRLSGGTTVGATLRAAHAAGIQVFATGGIGGVHRGARHDVSADLPALAQHPLIVVCAGAKAILDLPATLEWLETYGIPVLGWQTNVFPEFFSPGTGLPVSARVETLGEVRIFAEAHWKLGAGSAILLCVPCPADEAIPAQELHSALIKAERQAEEQDIRGQALTPFLLEAMAQLTGGATLRANLALLRNNARIAGELARAWKGP